VCAIAAVYDSSTVHTYETMSLTLGDEKENLKMFSNKWLHRY